MKFTKFISLFLALVMCLSIAMPVFAIADTKSISVKLAKNEVVPKSTVAPTEGPRVVTGSGTTTDGLEYQIINRSYAEITDYTGSATEITIPSTINVYPVTSIGNSAFASCDSLTSIEIPDSVTSIGNSAFYNCNFLTSVEIPDSVTNIGASAFYNCSSLKNVIVGNSTTSIGDRAFSKCGSLISIKIPNSTKSLSKEIFKGCISLTNIEIPSSVTTIDNDALNGCASLTSINIPNSVTRIGDSAFENCESLINVEFPDSVMSIGDSAFYDCDFLEKVTIGNGVKNIGDAAFGNCYYLASVTIGKNVESIGDSVFSWCASLERIEIPNSVTDIGEDVFKNCSSLISIEIPSSVKSIGDSTFYNTPYNLTIYGDSGSYAENYANEQFILFVVGSAPTHTAIPTVVPTSSPTVVPTVLPESFAMGDVNGDGTINSCDIVAILKHIGGIKTLESAYLNAADMNADYKVNSRDAASIHKLCLDGRMITPVVPTPVPTVKPKKPEARFSLSVDNHTPVIGDIVTVTVVFNVCPANINTLEIVIPIDAAFDVIDTSLDYKIQKNTNTLGDVTIRENNSHIFVNWIDIKETLNNASTAILEFQVRVKAMGTITVGSGSFLIDETTERYIPWISSVAIVEPYSISYLPTQKPTMGPTELPVVMPTPTPTEKPTVAPTPTLTVKPTATPTPVLTPTPTANVSELELMAESGYAIDTEEGVLQGVLQETRLETLLANFKNSNVLVTNANGEAITDNAFVGTGSIIKLVDENGNIVDGVEVAVIGDITGDAKINSRDIATLQKHIMEISLLDGVYLFACDVKADDAVNSRDIAQIQKNILGR